MFKGYSIYDGKEAFQIEFTDDLKRPVTFYYAFENDQPLGFEIYTGTMEEGKTVQVYFKNWEEQDGVKIFRNAVFEQGEYIFNYEFTKVEFNSLSNDDFVSKARQAL